MVTPELLDYVRQRLAEGVSKEVIVQTLVSQGWSQEDTNSALASVGGGEQVVSTPIQRSKSHHVLAIGVVVFVVLTIGVGIVFAILSAPVLAPITPSKDVSAPINTPATTSTELTTPITAIATSTKPATTTPPSTFVPSKSTATTLQTLTCGGMKIPLPEKWTKLELAKNDKLDAQGCNKSDSGCVCARMDPMKPTKGILFGVLVVPYPSGLQLDDLASVDANGGRAASDVKKFNLLGYPAIQWSTTGDGTILRSVAFFKDQKLYKFDFGASNDIFNALWPEFLIAFQGIKFQ